MSDLGLAAGVVSGGGRQRRVGRPVLFAVRTLVVAAVDVVVVAVVKAATAVGVFCELGSIF
jgi:hypothetical protein